MKIFIVFSLCLYSESVIYGQRLPIEASSFSAMRSEGAVYTDKSSFIEKLLDLQKPRFVVLTRPRRFGKTAFLDMLYHFFSANRTLFNGLYIDKRFPEKWRKYPVINLDFSTMCNVDSVAHIVMYEKDLEAVLWKIGKSYGLDYNSSYRIDFLIDNLHTKYGEKVVVLIDEYDKIFKKVNREDSDYLFKRFRPTAITFFERLKNQKDNIELLFITGVSKLSLSVFGTGLNNPTDLTFDKNFSSAMGFTLEEIKTNYEPSLQQLAMTDYGVNNVSQIITDLIYWYDGYRFSLEDNETKIFNPISVISSLRNLKIANYWTQTESIETIIKRIKLSQKNIEEFYYYNVNAENVKCPYDDEYSSEIPIAILMRNYGYLTIKRYNAKSNTVILGYPNKEIETVIKDKLTKSHFESTYVHAINMSLREGDMEAFIGFLNDKAFRDFNLPKSQKPTKLDEHTVTKQILNALIDSEIGAVYSSQLMIGEDGQTKGDLDVQVRTANRRNKKTTQFKSSTQFESKSFKRFQSDVVITMEIKVRQSAIKAMLQLLEYAVKHTNPFRMEIDKSSRNDLPTHTNLLAVNIDEIQNQHVKIQDWITIPYRNRKIFVNELQSKHKTAFHQLKTGWDSKKSKWSSADLESEKEIVVWPDEQPVTTEETTVTASHTTSESTTTPYYRAPKRDPAPPGDMPKKPGVITRTRKPRPATTNPKYRKPN